MPPFVKRPERSRQEPVACIESLESRIAPAYTASLAGLSAVFDGTAEGDTLQITSGGGLLMHNRGDAGFNSNFDFDSSVAGDQTLASASNVSITINTNGGNDTVALGSAFMAASSLLASFTVVNSGWDGDTLTIDDSARTTGNTYTVSSTATTGAGVSITFEGETFKGGRILKTGSGSDTVNLISVPSYQPISILAGNGDDTINVGSADNSLNGIGESSVVTLDGGAGNDGVNYNDQGNTGANDYYVDEKSLSRVSPGVLYIKIDTIAVENCVVRGSAGASSYHVFGQIGTTTVVAGSAGDLLNATNVLRATGLLTLNGGGGADTILGSIDSDILIGGPGDDSIFGADGSDSFTWNPGDGSDLVEGGAGEDILVFNGSAGAEDFTLSAAGTRFELLRNVGAIDMDVGDVEQVTLNALDGADTITVNNLFATSVRLLAIDLGLADAAADTVTIEGSAAPDAVHVSNPDGTSVLVAGLAVSVGITSSIPQDQLVISGNAGRDALSADLAARSLFTITLNGEAGAGFFGSATGYGTGREPRSVATGDVNGDGVPDLVVASAQGVNYLLGNPSGVFGAANVYRFFDGRVTGVAVGDLDGDGDGDVVASAAGSDRLYVIMSDGTPRHTAALALGSVPNGVIRFAQVDAGSTLDLVVVSKSGRVSVLLGNGDGTFQPAQKFATGGTGARDVVIRDLDNDGTADLAVVNQASNNVGVLRGNGDGTFQTAAAFRVGRAPSALTVGDFDGDGAADLVVAHSGSPFLRLFRGNSAAMSSALFEPQLKINYPGAKAPSAVVAADLDNDGRLDLVLANQLTGSFSTLIGLGNGTFTLPVEFDLGNVPSPRPRALVVADFNFDGLLDIAIANQFTHEVSVVLRVG